MVLDNIGAAIDMVMLYRVETITEQAQRQAEVIARPLRSRECMDNLEKPKGPTSASSPSTARGDGDHHRDAIASLFDGDAKCTDIIMEGHHEILEAGIDECEHVARVIRASSSAQLTRDPRLRARPGRGRLKAGDEVIDRHLSDEIQQALGVVVVCARQRRAKLRPDTRATISPRAAALEAPPAAQRP